MYWEMVPHFHCQSWMQIQFPMNSAFPLPQTSKTTISYVQEHFRLSLKSGIRSTVLTSEVAVEDIQGTKQGTEKFVYIYFVFPLFCCLAVFVCFNWTSCAYVLQEVLGLNLISKTSYTECFRGLHQSLREYVGPVSSTKPKSLPFTVFQIYHSSVEALCYKPEGLGFEPRWGRWIFQFT
jgi:hypothetical protein